MMTPIEIRPSPCPSQAPRQSVCKISPSYAISNSFWDIWHEMLWIHDFITDADGMRPGSTIHVGNVDTRCSRWYCRRKCILTLWRHAYDVIESRVVIGDVTRVTSPMTSLTWRHRWRHHSTALGHFFRLSVGKSPLSPTVSEIFSLKYYEFMTSLLTSWRLDQPSV